MEDMKKKKISLSGCLFNESFCKLIGLAAGIDSLWHHPVLAIENITINHQMLL